MAHTSCPGRGAIITYLNPDVLDPAAFLRGVVTGDHIVDPQTHRAWVPVQRPDWTLCVLDAANIVEVLTARDAQAEPG